jgi:PTS system nitrogen regulatory IIA component
LASGLVDLSVRDVARLLSVSEKTVHRWLRDKAIPAHRLHDQYRFNRVELLEWAAARNLRVTPELLHPEGGTEFPSLRAAVERGGIHHDVDGRTPAEVLEAVTRLPGIPDGVDRTLLHQLLMGREALTSTGVGGGFAIPHPRDPLVVRVAEPVVLVAFLRHPVDYQALDGVPVRVLFTILSPTVRVHLQLLSRIGNALHDAAFLRLLEPATPSGAILDRLAELEHRAGTGTS